MATMVSFYSVLNVGEDASLDEIMGAVRRELFRWHPDRNEHQPELAEEEFLRVQEAAAVLLDAGRRSAYDRSLQAAQGLGRSPASSPLAREVTDSLREVELEERSGAASARSQSLETLMEQLAAYESGRRFVTRGQFYSALGLLAFAMGLAFLAEISLLKGVVRVLIWCAVGLAALWMLWLAVCAIWQWTHREEFRTAALKRMREDTKVSE